MRNGTTATAITGAVLALTAVLAGPGAAAATAAEPVYTCEAVLVDDISRVAGSGCAGGPAGYEGAGSIKDAQSAVVWRCALLGSSADPEPSGKLTVVGDFGCERQGGDPVTE